MLNRKQSAAGRLPSSSSLNYESKLNAKDGSSRRRRRSHDSTSSAAERLQWRSHAAVLTPSVGLADIDPFEQLRLSEATEDDNGNIDPREPYLSSDGVNASEEKESRLSPGSSQNAIQDDDDDGDDDDAATKKHLSFRERIRHFTWTWFCSTMATGGIANVLHAVPFRFHGLYTLGCIFFILNIVLFLFNVGMISCRFYYYPRTFKASFLHPTESLFIPAAIVSFGIILINISQYGVGVAGVGGWLEHCMIVLFWLDCGLACSFSIGIYLIM